MGKKTISYMRGGWIKRGLIEEELTYERFENELHIGNLEFWFKYKNMTIDIAFSYKGKIKIYELNVNGYDEDSIRYVFNSPEELLDRGCIEGKTLKEIWDELET